MILHFENTEWIIMTWYLNVDSALHGRYVTESFAKSQHTRNVNVLYTALSQRLKSKVM